VKKDAIEKFILEFDTFSLYKQQEKISNVPNFIGVGAGRCGTTSIYRYLCEHPEVYMSPVKEINYFGFRDKETNPYGITFSEYSNFFMGAENEKIIGEISPAYLTLPTSSNQMKAYIPNVKIAITLRDPISRMISQYKHHISKHKINNINNYIQSGVKAYNEKTASSYRFNWFHPVKNLTQSLYFDGVKRILDNFPSQNIVIVKFDDLKNDSNAVMKHLCDFLEIDYRDTAVSKSNASSKPDNVDIKIEENVLNQLLKIYKGDLKKTEDMCGIELSSWLKKYE